MTYRAVMLSYHSSLFTDVAGGWQGDGDGLVEVAKVDVVGLRDESHTRRIEMTGREVDFGSKCACHFRSPVWGGPIVRPTTTRCVCAWRIASLSGQLRVTPSGFVSSPMKAERNVATASPVSKA